MPEVDVSGNSVKVPWVVVRRLALARAMAIRSAAARGEDWLRLHPSTREKRVREEEEAILEWIRAGVAVQFSGDYREAKDGGEPLVDHSSVKVH